MLLLCYRVVAGLNSSIWWLLLVVLLAVSGSGGALVPVPVPVPVNGRSASDECLSQCQSESLAEIPPSPGGEDAETFTFCGTDGRTHAALLTVLRFHSLQPSASKAGNRSRSSLAADYRSLLLCYAKECGVMPLYAGPCECPNYCTSSDEGGISGGGTPGGQCATTGTAAGSYCECNTSAGVGGADCSSVVCPHHKCSGHGVCTVPDRHTTASDAFPYPPQSDYCDCDEGWTGYDCSQHTIAGGTPHDAEANPIFNVSEIAAIHLTLSIADWHSLIDPRNMYNQTYVRAKFTFDSGNWHETVAEVGVHIRGSYTRRYAKKNWSIKFNTRAWGHKHRHWHGLKKLALKGGDGPESVIRDQLISEWYAIAGVAVARSSFATLWLNGVYHGLYWMNEPINKLFFKSRAHVLSGSGTGTGSVVGDYHTGNLYKPYAGGFLEYTSDKQSDYESLGTTNAMGVWQPTYQQTEGDGDWSDFIDLLRFVNQSDDATFAQQIGQLIDVPSLLRICAVETYFLSTDNYLYGNNYFMYKPPASTGGGGGGGGGGGDERWRFIPYDFDAPIDFGASKDVFEFIRTAAEWNPNPLTRRLFSVPYHRIQFMHYYEQLISSVMDERVQPQNWWLFARYTQFARYINSWNRRDLMARITSPLSVPIPYPDSPPSEFDPQMKRTIRLLFHRNLMVLKQLRRKPPPSHTDQQQQPEEEVEAVVNIARRTSRSQRKRDTSLHPL